MSDSINNNSRLQNSRLQQASPLQLGLAALKQKDYPTAIAHLELIRADEIDAASYLKAQMGLVKAYARSQQIARAIAHCEPLLTHNDSATRDWATQTYTELLRRRETQPKAPSEPTPAFDPTGFTPLANKSRHSSSPAKRQTPNPKPQNPKSKIQNPKSKIQNPKSFPPTTQRTVQTPTQPQSPATASQAPKKLTWNNAPRLSQGTSLTLGQVDYTKLWGIELLTAIATVWFLGNSPTWIATVINWICWQFTFPIPLRYWVSLQWDFTRVIAVLLIAFWLASPWFLDFLFQQMYGLKSLSLLSLEKSSPEAARLLKRQVHELRQEPPQVKLLPVTLPLIFSYGSFPRFHEKLPVSGRIVISQGLLDQLEPDEVAVLLAAELAHFAHWDGWVMSGVVAAAQLPYLAYWRLAEWAEDAPHPALQAIAITLSSLMYGIFRLCKLPVLWLSRARLYYSDRKAVERTGNPNGLTRALLKVAIATTKQIQQEQKLDPLLESLDLLLPVGYRNVLTTASIYAQTADLSVMDWERQHPFRKWMSGLEPHPPLGDRLHLLSLYAKYWHLDPELNWTIDPPALSASRQRKIRKAFLLQIAPMLGIALGWAIGLIGWGIGQLSYKMFWLEWTWLAMDRQLGAACVLLGFGIGMFLRINSFFPDVRPPRLQTDPALVDLLAEGSALPIESQPIKLRGTLLGQPNFLNWLHQTWMLQTDSGLVRLHFTSRFGVFGNLLPNSPRPSGLTGEPVTVTGWFRRGASPWIDVEMIQSRRGGSMVQSDPPIWSTILASTAVVVGIYILFTGVWR
jgi:Zn-dependent protease with chaperone function